MPAPQGTIHEIEFQSNELGEILTILIYLPANYSPLYKYSLVIAQDGKDYFQMGRLARFADELLAEQAIGNVIIAGIPYKSVKDRRRKYHPDGEENPAYIRFLAHELLPYLDKEYPTYQMGSSRTLMGSSLGASVSLMAAAKYPNIFGQVILQSPFVNEQILETVRSHPAPHLLDVYHVIGKEETEVKTTDGKVKDFLAPNRRLHDLFVEKGFHTFYEEFDGGHTWKYWQPDLKRAMEKML